MSDIEIKQEYPVFTDQCRACLSVGRNLLPLGIYTRVFSQIISNLDCAKTELLDKIQVCWECRAVLRRIYLFQQQLIKAYQLYNVPEYICGSLSSLTTIILNDIHPHTVFVYDTVIQNNVIPAELAEHSDQCDDSVQSDNDVKNDEVVAEVGIKEPKKRKNNVWATKRVQQNKKPKFKIVTDYTENCFTRIQIKNEEVLMYLRSQRDMEYFKSKKYKCLNCVCIFNNEKSLAIHNNKYHLEATPYVCDLCGSNIKTKRHLAAHIRNHYYKFVCPLCEFSWQDRSVVELHYRKCHQKIFECLKCTLKFGSRKDFYKHYKEWHERFICDYCGVSFKMRYCIKNHIRKQHSPFECKPCNKRFARYNGLWFHKKTRHSASTGAAYCVECDTKYPDVYRYKWHLANSARHKRRKKTRVPCPGCDKVFSKNIYMKDHYNLVHLKYFKYRCEQCDKNFIRNADLLKHTRRVHEGILPPKNKICYMCGRGFTTNKILQNHVRTHTGERPHACSACGARFAQRTTLRAHVRHHHAPAHTSTLH